MSAPWESFIVAVGPPRAICDEFDNGHYAPLWMIQAAMGDDLVIPMEVAQEEVRAWLAPDFSGEDLEALTQGYVELALHHPDSPLGLGIRPVPDAVDMLVVFHGWVYVRDGDGVMKAQGWRDPSWPSTRKWARSRRLARQWHETGVRPKRVRL